MDKNIPTSPAFKEIGEQANDLADLLDTLAEPLAQAARLKKDFDKMFPNPK